MHESLLKLQQQRFSELIFIIRVLLIILLYALNVNKSGKESKLKHELIYSFCC